MKIKSLLAGLLMASAAAASTQLAKITVDAAHFFPPAAGKTSATAESGLQMALNKLNEN